MLLIRPEPQKQRWRFEEALLAVWSVKWLSPDVTRAQLMINTPNHCRPVPPAVGGAHCSTHFSVVFSRSEFLKSFCSLCVFLNKIHL